MKRFLITALSSAMLLTSANTFAADLGCPLASNLQNTHFNHAHDLGTSSAWLLISEPFNVDGNNWNVGFIAMMPNAKTESQALQQGEVTFAQLSSQFKNQPTPEKYDAQTSCTYLETDTSIVVAVNPPAVPSSLMSKIHLNQK